MSSYIIFIYFNGTTPEIIYIYVCIYIYTHSYPLTPISTLSHPPPKPNGKIQKLKKCKKWKMKFGMRVRGRVEMRWRATYCTHDIYTHPYIHVHTHTHTHLFPFPLSRALPPNQMEKYRNWKNGKKWKMMRWGLGGEWGRVPDKDPTPTYAHSHTFGYVL